ncbi:Inosine/uridine-preferring nucleoside hydrolase domain-containing protein, partial [Cunninghamella echinulata]
LHDAPKDWEKHLIHGDEGITKNEERWFNTTQRDAADEILYQLKQSEPLTLTIVAIGPLTNIALAYQRDPITFSKAKRVVIMGGNVNTPGNTVPYAEFNFRADPHAADIVMATSKGFQHSPDGYQQRLSLIHDNKVAPMHVVVMPLDGSDDGTISKPDYEKYILPLGKTTPLYSFINAFMIWSFDVCLNLFKLDNWAVYDAYTVLLMIEMISDKGDGNNQDNKFNDRWEYQYVDMVVETTGKYTLGMCCTDKRAWAPVDKSSWGLERNNVQVILKGDGLRFRKILLNTIFDAKIQL